MARLAVGGLALCEIALLTLAGVDRAHTSRLVPGRVGNGFPQPPPCSVVDHESVVGALANPVVLTGEQDGTVGGSDLVRECDFRTPDRYPNARSMTVIITCVLTGPHGRPDNPAFRGYLDGPQDHSLSPAFPGGGTIHDNWSQDSTTLQKKYTNDVDVAFVIDNLAVVVTYLAPTNVPMSEFQAIRQQTISVAGDIAARLS